MVVFRLFELSGTLTDVFELYFSLQMYIRLIQNCHDLWEVSDTFIIKAFLNSQAQKNIWYSCNNCAFTLSDFNTKCFRMNIYTSEIPCEWIQTHNSQTGNLYHSWALGWRPNLSSMKCKQAEHVGLTLT